MEILRISDSYRIKNEDMLQLEGLQHCGSGMLGCRNYRTGFDEHDALAV